MTDQPAWQLILTAARQLANRKPTFSRAELITEVRRFDPTRRPASLGPIIQGMTQGTTGGPPSPCGTPLVRLGHGRYTFEPSSQPSSTPAAQQPTIPAQRSFGHPAPTEHGDNRADIALIGCVKTKLDYPAAARNLYVSPLFTRRRAHAERQARRYYILSAEHGLLPPETLVAPYDTALAEQSSDYQRAWGEWAAAKLLRSEGQIRDRMIEIHAGDEYANAITPLLTRAGATVRRPLAGLPLGEQLAWYDRHSPPPERHPALAGRLRETPRLPFPASASAPAPPEARAIVTALLTYGREHQAERAGTPPRFTPMMEGNELILTDPFAFLLAVIFDQGIPAERAWRAPYDLRQRLGHLDPARMATEPEQVRAAVAKPSALHRFVNNMPSWLVAAAAIVMNEYGGDAGQIWAGEPPAAELATRLRKFPGIAQKKSAMAVEILARDLSVPIRDLSGTDIAYDVHVRRVFLRTHLAERDDLDHMVEVARWLHPERPGELDYPAWLIGRRWCGPGTPDCATCPLRTICPRDVAQAAAV
ncbi:DUF6884 domain-containing protein [Micromonospora humida]|uniref:DUF6884 domain-containing protein n=1 Tax=Micromonospora humida TaxID=2809018 RepID=UPI0033F94A55